MIICCRVFLEFIKQLQNIIQAIETCTRDRRQLIDHEYHFDHVELHVKKALSQAEAIGQF